MPARGVVAPLTNCMFVLFVVWASDSQSAPRFNLYHTDKQHGCLYYYVMDDIVEYEVPYSASHQIIPYCLQAAENLRQDDSSTNESVTNGLPYTFAQLNEKQVSSQNLFEWSAPINLIERYQIFLNNRNGSYSSSLIIYHNCSDGWFGFQCQYSFDEEGLTFADLVHDSFQSKSYYQQGRKLTNGTCYTHIRCNRGPSPSCLDWREVCDGKRDCENSGIDEQKFCFELESNECVDGEYRCQNGQCIPHAFFRDGDPDCADQTDEINFHSDTSCAKDPSFRCEEYICRTRYEFKCGDGECISKMFDIQQTKCVNNRNEKMTGALFSHIGNSHLSLSYWFAILCLTRTSHFASLGSCSPFCRNLSSCNAFLQAIGCPSPFFAYPAHPVILGHVRFVFTTNVTGFKGDTLFTPDLVCYDNQLCDSFLNLTVLYNGSACHYYSDLGLNSRHFEKWETLVDTVEKLFSSCSPVTVNHCANLFQCEHSSTCISKHRLLDGVDDCFDSSDEDFNGTCTLHDPYRFQCSSDQNRCISPLLVGNRISNCPTEEDEKTIVDSVEAQRLPLFSMMCDWYVDMHPIFIDGREQTDETDCGSYFPCNHQYTQCDGFWNCPNGADEADCQSLLCAPFHHPCVSPFNNTIECLPLALAGDGTVHCRGGSDERHYCRDAFPEWGDRRYRCWNRTLNCIPVSTLCSHTDFLPIEDDEECTEDENVICPMFFYQNKSASFGICFPEWNERRSTAETLLCNLEDRYSQGFLDRSKRYLTLRHAGYFPFSTIQNGRQSHSAIYRESISSRTRSDTYGARRAWLCNRGILVFSDTSKNEQCLCPPAYYGDRCQYQNQRVSLTLQFDRERSPGWYSVFHFLVMLIDEANIVESHENIIYVPVSDCGIKYHLNLLYASQPKDPTKNYSVRIDAFTKKNLVYHASWHLLIRFQDLPVNHLVARLVIGVQRAIENQVDCTLDCGHHGQCMKYENTGGHFCRCLQSWSGYLCNIRSQCHCAPDSTCVGLTTNRSACVCSLGKFGTLCHLTRSSCHPNTCQHEGLCVPTDERRSEHNFTCLCIEGYSGPRCEFVDTKIKISFRGVSVPPAIFAHFIEAVENAPHIRTTVFKRIAFDQDTVTLFRSVPFHILLAQFLGNYYLIIIQEKHTPSLAISTQVHPSRRCAAINVLFNNTVLNYNRLRRLKYYHIPCQEKSQLVCFYDEMLLCLCNLDRHANCFEFDHNMSYNCQGSMYCKNGAQCFQDDPTCPKTVLCVCAECYYGTQCQFTTKGFDLSLDSILGYLIHPHIPFSRQPIPLRVCLVIMIIMLLIGLISNSLSILTFKSHKLREMGSGNYLLCTSIISLLTINIFALKFVLLVLSQMALLTNRTFLLAHCKSLDFLLQILPNMRDWIHACVSIERVLIISKGVNFDKTMSHRISKQIITFVILLVIVTTIHDPIYRRLIDDNEEQRTWCVITTYPRFFQIFNPIMNVFHFFVPFFINIISALMIIIVAARKRSVSRTNQTYKQHLHAQFREHKHLLVSPLILTLLALPRLIISFLSGCMKSVRNPWFFLAGYYASFISSISIFAVFVLPSNTYKTTFFASIQRQRALQH